MLKQKVGETQESGQSLIEFALVLGLIIGLLFVGIEVLNLARQRADLDKVVRQAARQAGELGGNTNDVEGYIQTQMNLLGLDPDTATVTIQAYKYNGDDSDPRLIIDSDRESDPALAGTCEYGGYIGVRIEIPWATNISAIGLFFQSINQSNSFAVEHINKCWRSG